MIERGLAIITGAAGGIGRACVRQIGTTLDLVLTDASTSLDGFAQELALDGYTVREAIVGDCRSEKVVDGLARHASGGFDALIDAAGLGPSAPWRDIFEVNQFATAALLEKVTPHVRPGSVAVLIASVAGHVAPAVAEIDALLAEAPSPALLDDLGLAMTRELGAAAGRAMGTLAYALSKKRVIDFCEAYAAPWGTQGGRIVSISPGMTFTSMGRHEASLDELAGAQVEMAPIPRWGIPSEIAAAAGFLLSPVAGFITGTDLRIDGGSLCALHAPGAPSWFEMLKARMAAD